MIRKALLAALLTGAVASPARAGDSAVDVASELAAMREKIAALEAEVATLKAASEAPATVAAAAAQPPAASASAAPREDKLTIKPFGRLQYDVAHVSSPDGIADPGLGFGNELRRARLGVEGTIPSGFGYKFEVDFADNNVEITDAILSWKASKALGITLGQHNNFQSLEELTSSRFLSFMERAAFTDAFGFERRVGLSATWSDGDFVAQAGVFTDNIEDLTGDENDSAGVDGRLVYAPKVGKSQLHVGGSAHWRDNGDPIVAAGTRYRQRPFVHTTDTRFLATPSLPVEGETGYGLEAAFIRGPIHAAAEAHWLEADTVVPGLSPTLFGGYVEVGYFLTGESRGYKGGRFDRTKVLKPIGDGGAGAFQLNLRYDRLDLTSGGIVGGTQDGFAASLIWIPQDHVRFLLNLAFLRHDAAAVAAAGGDRDYGVTVVGARAQVDF